MVVVASGRLSAQLIIKVACVALQKSPDLMKPRWSYTFTYMIVYVCVLLSTVFVVTNSLISRLIYLLINMIKNVG